MKSDQGEHTDRLHFSNHIFAFVERVHEHKHLGIYVSSTLCWSRQVYETF